LALCRAVCLGYPRTAADLPLLRIEGWQTRLAVDDMVIER
jgi:hypothetical protein